jgi:hypothetical protein
MADQINGNYVGEEAAGFISASLLSGETLGKENVTILPNVSYQVNLKKFDLTAGAIQNGGTQASCDFSSAGDVDYADQVLAPKRLKLNKQLCKAEWFSTFAGAQMKVGVDGTVPSSFAEYIISHAGALVGQETEKSIWQGAASTAGEFDGFATLCAATGSGVVAPTPTSGVAALSASNIIAELGVVRDSIPNAVYGNEDLNIYVPTSVIKFYTAAQAKEGYLDKYHAGQTELNFEGINLVWCPGMADDTMIAARKSNMFFATDLLSDLTEVKVLDMTDRDGSDNVRLVMKYNAGVGFASAGDVVYYAI